MRQRITGRFVIGFDRRQHIIYRDGKVVYEDDTILFVGHGFGGPVSAGWRRGGGLTSSSSI
jgi:hypothetical protein